MTELVDLASVIARAKQGEPEAFETLVDEYSNRLYGFLYRLIGSRDEAEDLVQEVFVRMVRMIGQYEHQGYFEPWLFRIATNLVRDRIRHISRVPEVSSLNDAGEIEGGSNGRAVGPADGDGHTPASGLELAEDVDRLQQALSSLSDGEREVLMLRHYGQLSFARIAKMMGTPLGTALARAHRGLGKLRELMESGS